MVFGALTTIAIFDKFKSAPEVAIDPSKRGKVVDSAPPSAAFPRNRNHPAVPDANPVKLHTPVFDTAPPEAAANVSPLVGDPGVNAPDAKVTVPNKVPVNAASAEAGCDPE